MKKHNFSSGPAILPPSVMEEAAQACIEYNQSGLSILEMSHRSPAFSQILEEARTLPKQLLGLDDRFEVLYLTGGASSQFFMVPMNLLNQNGSAAYLDTGSWSAKAIKEAQHFGKIDVIASSASSNFSFIPKTGHIPAESSYVHLTSNNTIYGTQIHEWPDTKVPIVCDMSSDIFSRKINPERFGLIFAGAQKNLGPAGTTMVIVRKDMLNKVQRHIPTMLDYRTHIAKHSSFNTPPVFPIFVCLLNLRWIAAQGGVQEMANRNQEKAQMVYQAIDELPIFNGNVNKEDRSIMNITFSLENQFLEKKFLDLCTQANISTIKGHRSVGGFRASIYNAMPKSSVTVLVEVMQALATKHG